MNKKIKFFLYLLFFLLTAQFVYAGNSFEVLTSSTIPAGSSFSDNTKSYGIYFTTPTVDYATLSLLGDITVNNNEKGIYCGNYGTLNLQTTKKDVTIHTSSNSKVGIQSQFVKDCYQSTTISVENINIYSDNDNIGLFTCGKMNITANLNDRKTINIINPSSAAIQVNAAGTFEVSNIDIYSNAKTFALLTGKTSSTTFRNTNININSQTGFLAKQDDLIYFINSSFKNEKEHFLTSQEKSFSSYITGITAQNSTIEGFIDNESNKVNFTLTSNSVWKMKKSSKVNELNISNSNVDLSDSNNTGFNTLTVEKLKGQGTNNQITLNTQLNGDDSLTDKIVITKSIEGKFILNINNVGGQGAKTEKGIKIVDTTIKNSIDTFKLKNSKIDIGAYVYTLQQGYADDNYSWFLKTGASPSEKTDSFVTISNTPQFMNFVVKTGMNELSKRLGDIRRTPLKKYNGVWVRAYGKNFDYNKDLKTKLNIFGVEAGYDFRINKTISYIDKDDEGYETTVEKINRDKWFLGIMTGFQNIGKIETEHKNSNKNGSGNGNSKSVGIYGSYIAQNGLFVDLTLRNFWMDFDIKTYSSSDEEISFKPQTAKTAFSAEIGKEFLFGTSKNILLEPKAELLFAYSPEVSLTANSNKIKYGSNILCNGKLGFVLGLLNKSQKIKRWLPYLETAYNYDFNNKFDISYSDQKQTVDFSGGYFDIGAGLNAYIGKGINCYGFIGYQTGTDTENFTWNLGIRYGF